MGYLKFIFIFLFELIKTNIVKTMYVIVAVTAFMFAGTYKDDVNSYDVAGVVKVDDKYVYVCRTINNNKVQYENIWDVKEMPIKDGKIYISSYSFANGFLWVVFSIFTIILVIATIVGRSDDDIGWELDDAWHEAFSTLIYCEEENGEFYYFALGRLISKRNRQISTYYNACRELSIGGFRDLYRCPKFQTKTQRRETLLNKIGIK